MKAGMGKNGDEYIGPRTRRYVSSEIGGTARTKEVGRLLAQSDAIRAPSSPALYRVSVTRDCRGGISCQARNQAAHVPGLRSAAGQPDQTKQPAAT